MAKRHIETILYKRFKYAEDLNIDDFESYCNSNFVGDNLSVLRDFINGSDIKGLVKTYHLASSRIQNLIILAAERYYNDILKGATVCV